MRRLIAAALAPLLSVSLLAAGPAATADTLGDTPKGASDDGVAPIVILLDTSGSMEEEDGAGTVKLRGAKAAVNDIIGQLSSTTIFGVWNYPTDGCNGGGYVSEPAALTQPLLVSRSVDAMTAGGDTPTGVALRALADDLTLRGYSAATIVLVSDGESTCGPPPCDIAQDLVDEGFNVTVPTIGFRTSDEGAAQLACVSEATGAATYNAGNSGELADQLGQLVSAQLQLAVRYDEKPMAGNSTRITATVTHAAGEPAKDVRLALTFADKSNPSLKRAAIPPIVRIGNIPAGESVEHSWVVGTGARDTSVTTSFTMSAWGANAPRVTFEGEYTTGAPKYVKEELGELFSQVTEETPLIIFGDSFSSGEGVRGDYDDTPLGVGKACHRHQETYLGAIFDSTKKKIVACSGAIMSALYWTGGHSQYSQIQEMNSLRYVPGAGILTFAGNDVGFADVVKLCILADCAGYAFEKMKVANALDDELDKTYKQAWSAINTPELRAKRDGRYVPLLVLPYPLLTQDWTRGDCYQFSQGELVNAGTLGEVLNHNIELAVDRVRRSGYEVYYVSDVEGAVRPDHTVCESGDEAYINGPIVIPPGAALPESLHPKASGYLAETDAIIRWTRTAEPVEPSVSDADLKKNLENVRPPVQFSPPPAFDPQAQTGTVVVEPGGQVNLQSTNYQPGSIVTALAYSNPTVLGSLVADDEGVIAGSLLIPTDLPLGKHELVVAGLDADGGIVESRVPLSVIYPTPLWVWAALAASILTLIAGAVFVLIGLARKRRAARIA